MKCNATPYEGKEPFAFISYCHADEGIVYPYIEMLAKRGYRVWYDEGINPGDDWPEVIAEHLDEATYFIAFISENSVKSHNCKREVNFAIQKRKAFMAVFLEEVKLSLGLEMALSTVQALKHNQYGTHEECVDKLSKNAVLNWCLGEENPHIIVQSPKKEIVHKNNEPNKQEGYSYDEFFLKDKKLPDKEYYEESNLKSNNIFFKEEVKKTFDTRKKKETIPKIEYKEIQVDEINNCASDTLKNSEQIGDNTEKQIQYFEDGIAGEDEVTVLNPILEEETILNPFGEKEIVNKLKNVFIRLHNECVFALNQPTTTIGRSLYDDYTIDDGKSILSRKHITVLNEAGDIYIVDNESKNHTYVNGKVIESNRKVQINDCDVVGIGNEKLLHLKNFVYDEKCNDDITGMRNGSLTFELPSKRVIRIGRSEESNDIIIKSNRVSRNHAVLVRTDLGICVIDLGSSNGTYVNGDIISYGEKKIIKYNDTVTFGNIEYTVV